MMSGKRISSLFRVITAFASALTCSMSYGQALFPSATTRMIAGQNIDIGSVTCGYLVGSRTDGRCNVQLEGGGCVSMAHLYIGDRLPASMAPGQFPIQSKPPSCVASWSLPFKLTTPGTCLRTAEFVAFHAEVSRISNNQQETAWGQGTATGSNWSMVFRLPCVQAPT